MIGATSAVAQEPACLLYDSHAHLIAADPVRYPRNPMQLDPPS